MEDRARSNSATGAESSEKTSSALAGESAVAGSNAREATDAGSNERRATYEESSLLSEIEDRSSRKRAASARASASKTVEITSRPSFGTDTESVPRISTRGSDRSSVIFIAQPRKTTTTVSGQSSITGAESTPRRSTTTASDQSSVIVNESSTRKSTTSGSGQRSLILAESNPKRITSTESVSGSAPLARSTPRRTKVIRPTQRQSIAVGTDSSWAPNAEDVAVRAADESTPKGSESSWSTLVQFINTSSTDNMSWGVADVSAAAEPGPRGSTEDESSPSRETDAIPSTTRVTYAGPSPSWTTVATPHPKATYAGYIPSRTTDATPRSSLATDGKSIPSRTPGTKSTSTLATYSKSTQTGTTDLRPAPSRPSVTEISPSESPETVTESIERMPSATRSIPRKKIATRSRSRRITGGRPRPPMATDEVGSPVQSEVVEEETVLQKNEWALRDLSVYQLTVKSLVVAVITGVQFSSGSNGEGGIYCTHNEGCIWKDKPEGTIGIDFQMDMRYVGIAVLSSVSTFIGLSRVPGVHSCWFLMPWLLMVALTLQKFHIAAVLNLLAFLTTCSHISAIFLMFLCLILFYQEINIFYEVFLCTWYLHEDQSLK